MFRWSKVQNQEKVKNTTLLTLNGSCFSTLNFGFAQLSLNTEYPATVCNLFVHIRRFLKINAQLNQEQ